MRHIEPLVEECIMPIVITASSCGQIVIPKDIRKALQIVPGKKLSIKEELGCILRNRGHAA